MLPGFDSPDSPLSPLGFALRGLPEPIPDPFGQRLLGFGCCLPIRFVFGLGNADRQEFAG